MTPEARVGRTMTVFLLKLGINLVIWEINEEPAEIRSTSF